MSARNVSRNMICVGVYLFGRYPGQEHHVALTSLSCPDSHIHDFSYGAHARKNLFQFYESSRIYPRGGGGTPLHEGCVNH